jgi:hypothetical protein
VLRHGLVRLEEDQAVNAAALAGTLRVDAAAQVTGSSRNRINEGRRSRRGDAAGRDARPLGVRSDREAS